MLFCYDRFDPFRPTTTAVLCWARSFTLQHCLRVPVVFPSTTTINCKHVWLVEFNIFQTTTTSTATSTTTTTTNACVTTCTFLLTNSNVGAVRGQWTDALGSAGTTPVQCPCGTTCTYTCRDTSNGFAEFFAEIRAGNPILCGTDTNDFVDPETITVMCDTATANAVLAGPQAFSFLLLLFEDQLCPNELTPVPNNEFICTK